MAETHSINIKSAVKELADDLPEDATWDDVMYRVYVRQAAMAQELRIPAGRFYAACAGA